MCKAQLYIIFCLIIEIISIIIMLWPISPYWASLAVSVCEEGVLMEHNLCYLNRDLRCYRLLKYCLKLCIFGKWCNLVMKERLPRTRKISWIVRRRDEPTGKYLLFSNRCRKVTRRGIKIFAAYELFRIFWFFIWYNSSKNRTCIAIVTRRWSEVEMTRNGVNFYSISNKTLFYPCEFNRVFL